MLCTHALTRTLSFPFLSTSLPLLRPCAARSVVDTHRRRRSTMTTTAASSSSASVGVGLSGSRPSSRSALHTPTCVSPVVSCVCICVYLCMCLCMCLCGFQSWLFLFAAPCTGGGVCVCACLLLSCVSHSLHLSPSHPTPSRQGPAKVAVPQ